MHKAPLFAAVLIAASPLPASAAVTVFRADLSGAQEVPPAATPATGTGVVTIDDVLNTMRVQINFSGLIGLTSASHIHCCVPPGQNAGVVTQVPTFVGFPLNVQAGSYDQIFDLTSAATYNPAFVTANGGTPLSARNAFLAGLNAGLAYVNVHTTRFPGGEIRGQLAAVPEPSTWALMLMGFGVAGWALRRRPARIAAAA